jgi:hypothetical protein
MSFALALALALALMNETIETPHLDLGLGPTKMDGLEGHSPAQSNEDGSLPVLARTPPPAVISPPLVGVFPNHGVRQSHLPDCIVTTEGTPATANGTLGGLRLKQPAVTLFVRVAALRGRVVRPVALVLALPYWAFSIPLSRQLSRLAQMLGHTENRA